MPMLLAPRPHVAGLADWDISPSARSLRSSDPTLRWPSSLFYMVSWLAWAREGTDRRQVASPPRVVSLRSPTVSHLHVVVCFVMNPGSPAACTLLSEATQEILESDSTGKLGPQKLLPGRAGLLVGFRELR